MLDRGRCAPVEELKMTARIGRLKERMLSEPRYASIEQAKIITKTYQANEEKPRTVSYTHLDVYKRQHKDNTGFRSSGRG